MNTTDDIMRVLAQADLDDGQKRALTLLARQAKRGEHVSAWLSHARLQGPHGPLLELLDDAALATLEMRRRLRDLLSCLEACRGVDGAAEDWRASVLAEYATTTKRGTGRGKAS